MEKKQELFATKIMDEPPTFKKFQLLLVRFLTDTPN
jgi:hypothetical protein